MRNKSPFPQGLRRNRAESLLFWRVRSVWGLRPYLRRGQAQFENSRFANSLSGADLRKNKYKSLASWRSAFAHGRFRGAAAEVHLAMAFAQESFPLTPALSPSDGER